MYSNILTSNKNEYEKKELSNLIKEISIGNQEALTKLYLLTSSSVYGYALSILKNIHEAEDVLHDVYIKIYENAYMYQETGKPISWILTITRNIALMTIRKKKHNVDIEEIIEKLPSRCDGFDTETKLLLTVAFKYISDEERNILMLHAVSGYKHREIANFLNLPLSTVLSKYNRTLKKIKKFMNEEEKNEK